MSTSLLKTIQDAALIEDQVLTNIGLRPYKVYWRKVTRTGADALLGTKGTETFEDKAFSPNPQVKRANLGYNSKYPLGYVLEGDIEVTFNAGQVTEAFLTETVDFIVFQDQLFKVVKVNDIPDNSTPIQRVALCRLHEDK